MSRTFKPSRNRLIAKRFFWEMLGRVNEAVPAGSLSFISQLGSSSWNIRRQDLAIPISEQTRAVDFATTHTLNLLFTH